MTQEFNLSERRQILKLFDEQFYYYKEENVKEFIRLLKIECQKHKAIDWEDEGYMLAYEIIDKLAEDKLI